jgi:hypothetical protein
VFTVLFDPKLYNEKPTVLSPTTVTRVEAGTNTSTVTRRVVGGDEKGSLKSEAVKYGHEFKWTRTLERLRWRGSAAYIKDRPVLSSERAPHRNKTVIVGISTPRLTN